MPLWKWSPVPEDPADRPVLFLDRDGVVIADRHYLADPLQVQILPGVPEAMALARQAGFLVVGVSNQSGIGRGRFTQKEFAAVMEHLDSLLIEAGAPFDAFFYCPHSPDQGCACRKPRPGMLEELETLTSWRREGSWVVGDKTSDVALGREAGFGGCLVRSGYGAEQEGQIRERYGQDPHVFVAEDLLDAVQTIVGMIREEGR